MEGEFNTMTNKEMFLKCATDAGIRVADNSMTKVSDYQQAVRFFRSLRENKVKLGMDMASLTCSGDVEIIGEPSGHICLVEKDNGSNDYFKFKEMIIINGNLNDPESAPEIFIESDEDTEWLKEYEKCGFEYPGEGRYLGLKVESDGTFVYDKESVDEYLDMEEEAYYDSEIVVPKLKRLIRNTRRELLVYINVQGCKKRHRGNSIVYRARNYTCDELIQSFSKRYKEI